jgi:hypothetical protein
MRDTDGRYGVEARHATRERLTAGFSVTTMRDLGSWWRSDQAGPRRGLDRCETVAVLT